MKQWRCLVSLRWLARPLFLSSSPRLVDSLPNVTVFSAPPRAVRSLSPHLGVYSSCWYHTSVPQCASAPASGEASAPVAKQEDGLGVRLLKLVGWMGGFYSRKAVLVRSAKVLYENCMDNLKYEDFFEVCSMPDSFQSWFVVAHLHVWFFMVRLKREGKDGEYLIRQVVATFWYDVEHRMRAMEVYNSLAASRDFRELVQQFYGLTLAYEEGLLSDDKFLASAVWRNMIFEKDDTHPTQVATMVDYIRKQVLHMDSQDTKLLLERGEIHLMPFNKQ